MSGATSRPATLWARNSTTNKPTRSKTVNLAGTIEAAAQIPALAEQLKAMTK